MNFGDILNEWDKETAKAYGKKKLVRDERREIASARESDPDSLTGSASGSQVDSGATRQKRPESGGARANPMDVWLRRYGTCDKDTEMASSPEAVSPAERRRRLRVMKPEATLDLHGLTRDDAWYRLEAFFADCRRRGMQKVLIIHGKGNHSGGDPVLRQTVLRFIEQNPHAGESGSADKESGGSGSTWVILK
jgi:DNA-nicking Smr family endonuclease